MEAECENVSEHCNENSTQNSNTENEITTYSETVTYAHFVETHEESSPSVTHSEMKSYSTEEHNVETNVSYSENTEAITNDDAKELIEDENSEEHLKAHEVSIQETTTDGDNEDQNVVTEDECPPEYKVVDEMDSETTLNEDVSHQDSNIIVEEPLENTQEKVEDNFEQISDTTVEEIDNAALAEYETIDSQDNCNVLVTEVEDGSNTNFESVRTEDGTCKSEKDERQEDLVEHSEKVDEADKQSLSHNIAENTNSTEGDLVIEELNSEQVEENREEQEETVVYEVTEPKERDELQITHAGKMSIEENENKSMDSETIIFRSVDSSSEMETQHITFIDTSDSIDFTGNTIIEEVGVDDQSFSEDLNSTVTDSFSHDSMSQDSSMTEEVIIIQQIDSEESVEDPQSQETEKSDQSATPDSSTLANSKPKGRKGRKATFDIPMHVLGHDISKPVEPVVNGRAIPRPRLGVKVPYRNLTSQIVSKAEIEKEIMERGRLKMELNKGDQKFARSLTQRLVKKLTPSTDPSEPTILDIIEQKGQKETAVEEKKSSATTNVSEQTSIQNDSDLLAILEGDGDETMPVMSKEETTSPQVDETNLKALEREIALQQLSELPHQTPKQRIFRGKSSKHVTPSAGTPSKEKSATPVANNQTNTTKEKNKENTSNVPSPVPKKEYVDVSPRKQPVEIEPQVKVNMVLKTYSRKRKISEPQDPLKDYPPPKKPVYDSPDDSDSKMDVIDKVAQPPSPVYITKSSRVIKKKVIWDPDEVPVRSPKPSPKPPASDTKNTTPKNFSATVVKTVKTDKNSNNEKVVEKKVAEKKPQEKKVDRPQSEKKTPPKKSMSPKSNSANKPKKLRSEIDKLLMDEGAVKMLYELNNTDETATKKKKDFYSVERAHKEIIKKANLLKNELEQTRSGDTHISLRKKEAVLVSSVTPSPTRSGPILERKMSKDSTRSSVHTPPPSPFQHSQSSMLIRRRSSSSLSSDDMEIEFKPREIRRKSDGPKLKKSKKSEESEVDEGSGVSNKSGQTPKKHIKATVLEVKLNQYRAFTVKKTGRHVNIDLNYIDEKCCFSKHVLEELITILRKFSKDKECQIVTITSSSKAFCLGLDYATLIAEDEETRKEMATSLSDKVKDFLLCLLHFPKVLVACIQGDCMGLGVTMLPLFDIVIASDSATFTTHYANLGCMGEGAFLLSYPNLVTNLLASEMLFTGQKITADEAFRRGLVSKLCWPEKYKETMKTLVGSVVQASKQSLEASKKQLRVHKIKEIEAAINSERKIWVEHWTSAECQEKFLELKSQSS